MRLFGNRLGPSGSRLIPVPAQGIANWTVSGPVSFRLAEPGHPPGLYSCAVSMVVKTTAAAGSVRLTLAWDEPELGPVSFNLVNGALLNSTPGGFQAARHVVSSGLGAIVFTASVNVAVVGSPIVALNCPLEFILSRLPRSFHQ